MWKKELILTVIILVFIYFLKPEWTLACASGIFIYLVNAQLLALTTKKANDMNNYAPSIVLALFFSTTVVRFILIGVLFYLLIVYLELEAMPIAFSFIFMQSLSITRHFKKRKKLTD